ncbi:MAG TPA: methyltransferase [Vicinamibacterales bacterium]|nr:methyltransferase [Vicinamibacterales bacterium]
MFSQASKARLTRRDAGRFATASLFDRVGRAVCEAGCLPRKELYEAWEVARRARRRFRGGRVVDLAGGHGLLAHVMLLLDDSSPEAVVVDAALPASRVKVHEALAAAWPRLAGRVRYVEQDVARFDVAAGDIVVSSHACGALTDRILAQAADAGARLAVLPCCQDLARCDAGALEGWLDGPLAVDVMRAVRLEARGYRVWTQTIPEAITPKNRLLMGSPR